MLAQEWLKFSKLFRFLFGLYLAPALFLLILAIASLKRQDLIPMAMRDPATMIHFFPLMGFVSNLGALLWSASATICLFGWALLRDKASRKMSSSFFLGSGLLTMLLALDDFFLIHEVLLPRLLHLSEKTMFLGYGVLLFSGLYFFRKLILKSDYLILLVALGFFGLSFSVDLFQYQLEYFLEDFRILFEDGFKFLGIVGWLGYFSRTCFRAIRE